MAAKHFFEREGYFADGRLGPRGLDRELKEICGSARTFGQGIERVLNLAGVPLGSQSFELGDLPRANGGRIDLQNLNIFPDLGFEPVDSNHRFDPAVDARLGLGGRFFDAEFRDARLNGLRHAADRLDLLDMRKSPASEGGG